MATDDARLVLVKVERADRGTLYVEIDRKLEVDAIFTSKSAVDKILFPFYQRLEPDEAKVLLGMELESFRKKVDEQFKKYGWVCVPHMHPCRGTVPDLVLDTRPPARF